jgi:hypothetical protein
LRSRRSGSEPFGDPGLAAAHWRVQTIARTIARISWLTAGLRILSQPANLEFRLLSDLAHGKSEGAF